MLYLQRKYIDLIRHVSSKWVNWDPPVPVEVGAYGEIERATGELRIAGNIYSAEFQSELDQLGLPFRIVMADHPPKESDVEGEHVISSKGAKRVDLNLAPQASIAGLASASFKSQWQFEEGKRDAVLVMKSPKIQYIPTDGVLEKLLEVPILKEKYLVTKVHVCPAYSMYLSSKRGEKVTLALAAQVPVPAAPGISAGAEGGVDWQVDTEADFFRKGCDKDGRCCYSPLYAMKRRARFFERLLRDGEEDEETRVPHWEDATLAPWDPLDEDGREDVLDLNSPLKENPTQLI